MDFVLHNRIGFRIGESVSTPLPERRDYDRFFKALLCAAGAAAEDFVF